MIQRMLQALALLSLCVVSVAWADERAMNVEAIRFKDGRVADISVGTRAAAPDDKREWLVLRLNEVGVVVVGEDGKSEVLAIDKHGGVYINGDLYIKGVRVGAGEGGASSGAAGMLGSRWFVLLLFLLSVLTSVSISIGLRRRGA